MPVKKAHISRNNFKVIKQQRTKHLSCVFLHFFVFFLRRLPSKRNEKIHVEVENQEGGGERKWDIDTMKNM